MITIFGGSRLAAKALPVLPVISKARNKTRTKGINSLMFNTRLQVMLNRNSGRFHRGLSEQSEDPVRGDAGFFNNRLANIYHDYVLTSIHKGISFVLNYLRTKIDMFNWVLSYNVLQTSIDVIERGLSMRLSDMKEGETGKITRIGGNGALRRRILEMGLLKDSEVYVEKYAPLKDPIELIVKGYHLSMRVNEASQIMVEKLGTSL